MKCVNNVQLSELVEAGCIILIRNEVKKRVNACFYSAVGSVGLLTALHTLPTGRTVHYNTNVAYPGSILPMQQLRATTKHSHFQQCL